MQINPVPPVTAPAAADTPAPEPPSTQHQAAEPVPPVRPTLQDLIDIDRNLLALRAL